MTRRTKVISKTLNLSPSERKTLRGRIASLEHTIKGLETMTSPGGEKWRAGMLKHYRGILAELKRGKHTIKTK